MTENTQKPVVLSTAYLPPISYFAEIVKAPEVYIEKHENFVKQTYRNRCRILGANGPIPLVIPVEKARDRKVLITDTRIYNHENWQRIHWRTIFSAYNSSPFFEYYQDYLSPFYENRWDFLFDFNLELMTVLIDAIGAERRLGFTEFYKKPQSGANDLRNSISPKTGRQYSGEPYTQVFSEKFGFINDLSIIDLLFNLGPETLSYLEKISGQASA